MKTEYSFDFNTGWSFESNKIASKMVTLPHDAMLTESRSAENASGSGGAFFGGGTYRYKKLFLVPMEWKDKIVRILFEGIYRNAAIFMNGEKIAQTHYGYTEYRIELTPFLRCGEENKMEVLIDHENCPDSRWYTGVGIYRPVTLEVLGKAHILPETIQIKTISINPAQICIQARWTEGEIQVQILKDTQIVAEGELVKETATLEIPDAELWSAGNPHLYQCKMLLFHHGELQHECQIPFGIRMLEWSNKGFFVNGENTLLRGGCLHSDNGILGACSYKEAEWRRIKILKEAGFNAIRSSHNPCPKSMLDACDHYGMYVIDETWDMWYQHKNPYDYAGEFLEYYEADLRSMLRKDFNHPSVIAYSIGNEVSEPASEQGMILAANIKKYIQSIDLTRPVTAGINLMIVSQAAKGQQMYGEDGQAHKPRDMSGMDSAKFNQITQMVGGSMNHAADGEEADAATSPILDLLDIAGYNYASGRYPLEGVKHPERAIYGSETFPQDLVKNWKMVREYPYLIGDFMWTAWDYLGETGAGAWAYTDDAKAFAKPYPWLLSGTGVIDILGNPTGEVFLAKAVWEQAHCLNIGVQPVNHADEQVIKSSWRGTNSISSWSFANCDGNEAIVEVYSKEATVELFLNGSSMGRQVVEDYKAEFSIEYRPGILEAAEFDANGNEAGRTCLQSAEGELRIQAAEEESYCPDSELIYLNISICGENGMIESNADEVLTIEIEGGEVLGFGSANPRTEESFLSGCYKTYYGQAQAVVRKTQSTMKVCVKGETLGATQLFL